MSATSSAIRFGQLTVEPMLGGISIAGLAALINPAHEANNLIESVCSQGCGEKFMCRQFFASLTACDSCREKADKKEKLERAKIYWESICDESFRDTDKNHPQFPKSQYEATKGFAGTESLFLFGPSGCLDAETYIQYGIKTKDGRRQNSKGGTIERLYLRFNGLIVPGKGSYKRKQTIGSEFTAPSIDQNGRIFHNRITAVVYSGVKPCVKITTETGETITATRDHRFWNGAVFVVAGNLLPGDVVHVHNGTNIPAKPDDGPDVRNMVYVKSHPHAPLKAIHEKKTNKTYYYHALRQSRAVVEAAMNRMSLNEYVKVLNEGKVQNMQFLPPSIHVHHKDENKRNDSLKNLEIMLHADHCFHHAKEREFGKRFISVPVKITGISEAGERKTFDVSMESPHNNFIADGFVVHNSGKSRLGMILIKRCLVRYNMHVGVLWPEELSAVKGARGRETLDMIAKWGRYDVLLMDDSILAGAQDGRVTDFLKQLLDYRMRHKRHQIVTSQIGSAEYMDQADKFKEATRADKQLIEALLRRVREACKVISFADSNPQPGQVDF